MNYDVVVVASGKGLRAGLGFNKVFYVMKNGKTVLESACTNFISDDECKKIVVVTEDEDKVFKNPKVVVTKGGAKRANSVYNGLVKCESEYVMVHDGARPFINKTDIEKLKEALNDSDGAMLAKKAVDTIKYVKDGYVKETIDRENIYLALTPQAFKRDLLTQAYETINVDELTDDASVFEKLNYKVKVVEGDSSNIKLTNPEDFKNL